MAEGVILKEFSLKKNFLWIRWLTVEDAFKKFNSMKILE